MNEEAMSKIKEGSNMLDIEPMEDQLSELKQEFEFQSRLIRGLKNQIIDEQYREDDLRCQIILLEKHINSIGGICQ